MRVQTAFFKHILAVLLTVLFAVAGAAQNTAASNTASQPAKKQVDAKNSFKEYELGQPLSSFNDLIKVRPNRGSIVGKYEDKCEFYSPKEDVKIGDFTVQKEHIFLIFFNKKLMRIRIFNVLGSFGGRDLKFYQALLGALTTKYGQVKSTEPLWTPYAGDYQWKTDKITLRLRFERLEYTHIAVFGELRKTFEEGERITPADI